MSALVPKYKPCPHWNISPETSKVQLGRLIRNPDDPETFVTHDDVVAIDPKDIQPSVYGDWSSIWTNTQDREIGLWAKCLHVVGLSGGLTMAKIRAMIQDHKFKTLETVYFVPTPDYIERAINDNSVKGYINASTFRKPVYMIIGLKIARGASASNDLNTTTRYRAALEADGTSAGVLVSGGPAFNYANSRGVTVSFGTSSDYVFAYRLLKIRKKPNSPAATSDYKRGALFGSSNNQKREYRAFAQKFDFIFDDDDMGIPDVVEPIEKWQLSYEEHKACVPRSGHSF